MSVDSTTQTGTDLNNNADDSPLIGSAFGDYTPKQRRVLVAADAMAAESGEVCFTDVADNAGVPGPYVYYVLGKALDAGDISQDCSLIDSVICGRSYESLTDMQRQLVNEFALNDLTASEAAEVVGCSLSYAFEVQMTYGDLIEAKRC